MIIQKSIAHFAVLGLSACAGMGDDVDVADDVSEWRGQAALNATSSTIGSVLIPFRGVVRATSGADSNERDARETYERGLVRRAYLKGIASQTERNL